MNSGNQIRGESTFRILFYQPGTTVTPAETMIAWGIRGATSPERLPDGPNLVAGVTQPASRPIRLTDELSAQGSAIMRKQLAATIPAVTLALTLAACGNEAKTFKDADASLPPKDRFIAEVIDAGFLSDDYANMWERAQQTCSLTKDEIVSMMRIALINSNSEKNMKEQGIDTEAAASRYADLTKKYACP